MGGKVQQPAGMVPAEALAFGSLGGDATQVDEINRLPVAIGLNASGKAPVAGSFTAVGASAAFTPIAGRDFNVTIDGTFSAAIQIERSFDAGASWHVVLTDALRQALPASFSLSEGEVGVTYRLNCTSYTSGTANYRVSQ